VPLSQCCAVLSCARVLGLLLPHLSGTVVEAGWEGAGRVWLLVRPSATAAACQRCGQLSGRVHGGYWRRLRDVPAGGRDMVIWLAARRFRCLNPACPAVTFTEQVPGLTSRYSRRTPAAAAALGAIAVALCGRAGARLAAALGMALPSRHTMIRLVMAVPLAAAAAPPVLGVDDFALRRGHVYGTVLVDIGTGDVVDLLPDRQAATLEQWLADHPGVAVICRDRAGGYADGARGGAPAAIQVADRWHLLHNLCGRVYEAAAAHRASCLGASPDQPQDQQEQHGQDEQDGGRHDQPGPAGKPGLPERTRQRHAQVHQLLAAGHTRAAAARILGLSLPTVYKYANAASPGQLTPAARDSVLDPYKPYLIARWNDGARDARALHAELTARGYTGSDQQVRRFVRPFRELPGPVPAAPPAIPSARKITSWLMTSPGNLTPADAAALAAVTTACPHLAELSARIRAFADMMTALTGTRHLDPWLTAAQTSSLDPLRSFARGIRKDHDAVLNALSLPWSSGKVEGTVNKIKMLKRQTYGRASFDLLRKRVLLTDQAP
jgi:transposase/DNA-binding CsgD family transcriptional regulator